MIEAYGNEDGWGEAILEQLQEDRLGSLANNDGGLSPAEAIIGRSLDNLSSDDLRRFFQLMSCTAEDCLVPVAVAAIMWSSDTATSKKSTKKLAFRVRKMVLLLLKANLFLGSPSLFSFHDIGEDKMTTNFVFICGLCSSRSRKGAHRRRSRDECGAVQSG